MSGNPTTSTVSYTYNAAPADFPAGWPWTPTLTRSPDNAIIPLHLENMDYQQFLSWIAAGNPAPAGWTGPKNPAPA
jgi:hypothetical protein